MRRSSDTGPAVVVLLGVLVVGLLGLGAYAVSRLQKATSGGGLFGSLAELLPTVLPLLLA